jgi:competence protein ComEA
VQIHAVEAEVTIDEEIELAPEETELVSQEVIKGELVPEEIIEIEPEESQMAEYAGIATATIAEEGATPGFESEDEAMAWLESLAARQGALEEELLTKPEERPIETPEWIQQLAEETTEEQEIPDEKATTGLIGAVTAGMVAKQVFDQDEVIEEPSVEVPEPSEWLADEPVYAAVKEHEPVSLTEEGSLIVEAEETLDTQMAEIAGAAMLTTELTEEPLVEAEPAATEMGEPQPAEEVELPDWLRGLESEAVAPTPEIVSGEWVPPGELGGLETIPAVSEEITHLDINAASLAQLERIPGIGFIVAQSIVAYREVNGPFTNLDQLQEIPGISSETFDELKRRLVIEMVAEAAPPPPRIPELAQAWQNIANGNVPAAVDQYSNFIHRKQDLDEVIAEIQEALLIYPLEPLLFQTLGDAYLRSDRLSEAMEAYNHAEDLLK